MLADLPAVPADAILHVSALFRADPRRDKIDLGVGVYRTADGRTPVMAAVAEAQAQLLTAETTKAYTPPEGVPGYPEAIASLVFGDGDLPSSGRLQAIQTTGGCGALRIAAELMVCAGYRRITVGTPTWANHQPLLTAAGLAFDEVPYYDAERGQLRFEAFMDAVERLGPGDALLLHGGCHNPTGADPDDDQWQRLCEAARAQGFLVLVDLAYHGFGAGLEEDAVPLRRLAAALPELLVTYSCSKNFGLYRERTGALLYVAREADQARAVRSQALRIARGLYSMPPAHGGAIVAGVLASAELTGRWREELAAMREEVAGNRRSLVAAARATPLGNRLDYIAEQRGMFSLLPMSDDAIVRAREDFGIYVVGGGRINLCGVSESVAPRLAEALVALL